jgi:hypothetical protein
MAQLFTLSIGTFILLQKDKNYEVGHYWITDATNAMMVLCFWSKAGWKGCQSFNREIGTNRGHGRHVTVLFVSIMMFSATVVRAVLYNRF